MRRRCPGRPDTVNRTVNEGRDRGLASWGTTMEQMKIEAIYEHGTLKLTHELPLPEGQKVLITILPAGSAMSRLTGLVPWHGSREDLDCLILSEDTGPLETP